MLAFANAGPDAALATDFSATPVPKDGTYRYVFSQSGSSLGSSTITVKHSQQVLKLSERLSIDALEAQVQASYDSATLIQNEYVADIFLKGVHQHLVAKPSVDGLNVTTDAQSLDIQSLKDSPVIVVGDDFVGSLFILPAMFKVSASQTLTQALIAGGHAIKVSKSPQSTSGKLVLSVGDAQMRIDYDPVTCVVRRITIPTENVSISLVTDEASPVVK